MDEIMEYSILQLKNGSELADKRFCSLRQLKVFGLGTPDPNDYECVYRGTMNGSGDVMKCLDGLYTTFNIDHPDDFTGHSMSVSDVILLYCRGGVEAYYVDSYGFAQLDVSFNEALVRTKKHALVL